MSEFCEWADHWVQQDHPVQRVCQVLGVPRGTYYAWRQRRDRLPQAERATLRVATTGREAPGYRLTVRGEKIPDGQIVDGIVAILEEDHPAYGYRKLTVALQRRYALVINKKKVYRLCREMDILWPQRQRRPLYPRRLPRHGVITRPNQWWQTDLKYGAPSE